MPAASADVTGMGMLMEGTDAGTTGDSRDGGGEFPIPGGPAVNNVEAFARHQSTNREDLSQETRKTEFLVPGDGDGSGGVWKETFEFCVGGVSDGDVVVGWVKALEEKAEDALGTGATQALTMKNQSPHGEGAASMTDRVGGSSGRRLRHARFGGCRCLVS